MEKLLYLEQYFRGISPPKAFKYFSVFQVERVVMATKEFEYPLGVIHGDGHVSHERKGITITVSLKDENYKDLLKRMFVEAFGCELHEYRQVGGYHLSTWKLEATRHFLGLKHFGHWIIPKLEHPEEYLAGLFDTDGHVGLRFWRGTTIMGIKLCQKPNGNLKKVMPMRQALGLNSLMRRYKCGRHSQDISAYARASSSYSQKKCR